MCVIRNAHAESPLGDGREPTAAREITNIAIQARPLRLELNDTFLQGGNLPRLSDANSAPPDDQAGDEQEAEQCQRHE